MTNNGFRATRDSFLHFLDDGLSFPVNNVRVDKNVPQADRGLQMNCLNVKFLGVNAHPIMGSDVVSLDLVADDELQAIAWLEELWTLLSGGFYTPKLDYTDPQNPVPTGYNIYWETNSVRFVPIHNPLYYHLHCTLALKNHIS